MWRSLYRTAASHRMRKVLQLKYHGISPRNRDHPPSERASEQGRGREGSATFSLGRSLSSPLPLVPGNESGKAGRQAMAKEGMEDEEVVHKLICLVDTPTDGKGNLIIWGYREMEGMSLT